MKLKRLPGKKRRYFGLSTLWLAADHLLAVEFNGYTEAYKRFLFKDIQALTARKTNRRLVWSVLLGAFACLAAIPALYILFVPGSRSTGLTWFTATLAAVFLLCLLLNVLRGPTCICHVQTALGLHELPSLHRLRLFSKAVAKLRPLITTFQGEARDLLIDTAPVVGKTVPRPAVQMSGMGFPKEDKESGYDGNAHLALYGLMFVQAALSWFRYSRSSLPLSVLALILALVVLFLTFITLNRHRRFALPGSLKVVSWIVMITVITEFIAGQIFTYAYPFFTKRIDLLKDHYALSMTVMKLKPADNTVLAAASLFHIAFMSICGLWGLTVFAAWRRKVSRAPAPTPPQTPHPR